ncbi:2Fe-2S iron-sulfur cluster-binding protein [Pseudoduganella violaceinigra]|uniref:2Fe-2S iron-sulfur cluster-binding protein n=1 Tax=Pseudoduganella violaceinigra TaxID=246602 RepID=UPI001E44B938|nr:2Fe-2S iron-sulfur cluster binding domain-containing protein [Pseudoduganella violaceinigra]
MRTKRPVTAYINGCAIGVEPKETLLQAALRAGLAFPHSCRTGSCTSCKCRLLAGDVQELTDAAYVLGGEPGSILACQSVPLSDVSIEVDLSRPAAPREVQGRIVGQRQLTHDIAELCVQLDDTLHYKAGQFAELSIDALPGVRRSYSFATPVRPDSKVLFHIRRVRGGEFSVLANDAPLLGKRVALRGPAGDFWLRPGRDPVLMAAGGSGLAPILAMLHQALEERAMPPVTLLFGVREQRDLYAQQEIGGLAAAWQAPFRYQPVVGAGRDALVHAAGAALAADTRAYLCGSPGMVDSISVRLQALGLDASRIHADRFHTRQELAQ